MTLQEMAEQEAEKVRQDSRVHGMQSWPGKARIAQAIITVAEAHAAELERWVDDLQSGMYVNCVYCGHRYGPDTETPMRSTLEAHIALCPKHPLSAMKQRAEQAEAHNKELIDALKASRAEMIRRSNAVNTKPPNYNPWFVDWDIISTIDVALTKAGAK